MAIQIQITRKIDADPAAKMLLEYLVDNDRSLELTDAIVYYGYPRYRDADEELLVAKVLIASPKHGVAIFGTVNCSSHADDELALVDDATDALFGQLYGKLVANRRLRQGPRKLHFWMEEFIFAPFLDEAPDPETTTVPVVVGNAGVASHLRSNRADIPAALFDEITATIDGSKAIPRPRKRGRGELNEHSKGAQIMRLEAELATFDNKQREGSISAITGLQRIRGLAGSGKTIVLTKKAALVHLDNPDAKIVYTFFTKSLYQQIRRLITRFYRAEHDHDPDWTKLQVLHAWGGADPGVYSLAAAHHLVQPLRYDEANRLSRKAPFEYACYALVKQVTIEPMYDYIFMDEGQDSPASYLRLCSQLVRENKLVYAYDDLQTIFQVKVPTTEESFGVDKSGKPLINFERDIVLYKCYRNPLEILVCAHALGFGIYGDIVQMLENDDHWRDIGYEIVSGEFSPGAEVVVRRPEANSLASISKGNTIDEIIRAKAFGKYMEEIDDVVNSILGDIKDGLRPDDILVVVVDDRNAQGYLKDIAIGLSRHDIRCNNIHAAYGVVDFQQDELVTLTTVHKAKGNEAFMVYVVGVDAVFNLPDKRSRNTLFTAMTRAKGWLRVSGIGSNAESCIAEIEEAKRNCPELRFTYPSPEQLELIRRDLGEQAVLDLEKQRMFDEMSDEEFERYRANRKRDKPRGKR